MNCTYCHEDRDGFVTPVEKNGHAVIWNYRGNTWMLCLKAKGWKSDVQIYFCPMCGRKLSEPKEE